MSTVLWQPTPDEINKTSVFKLIKSLNLKDFSSLHKWSIEHVDQFWDEVWQATNILGNKGEIIYQEGAEFFEAKFFPDSWLNVGENLLTNELTNQIAISAIAEDGSLVEISWDKLRSEVKAVANAMLNDGISPKDRVVAWTPNLAQTIIFTLAALSIGAVVSTASSDFAAEAVIDRFSQIEPALLLAATTYTYNGKKFDLTQNLKSIADALPSLKRVIVIDENAGNFNFTNWQDWKSEFANSKFEFPKFRFDHPGFILFSSGTTGKPKCIIHSAAGVLLKLKAEQLYNLDLSSKDKIFFYTTTGWMMWNWLLYCLASKANIVLYSGSPIFPKVDRLLEIAELQQCTQLGVSAKYIDLLNKAGINTQGKYPLAKLKMLLSTGSVLAPQSFEYVYQNIKANLHLASISGGTDICGCFVSAVPVLPVYAGEIQGACLGMAVEIFDDSANPAAIDEKGELVCTKPFPSMPLGFWNDSDNKIYKKSYFSKFENIWTHGDFAAKSSRDGFVIFGRSDATLNSSGVRIGTAEIYRVVDQIPEVLESLAVAKEIESDTKVILFVVLQPQLKLNEELISKIKGELKTKASPRHVPDLIIQAPQLPRTKSNKLVELAVADSINGKSVRNKDALANPEALDWFTQLDFADLK